MTATHQPPRCADHPTRYGKGCPSCAAWARWYNRNRRRRVRAGTWEPMVDVETVRNHVRSLLAQGMLLDDIAPAAGVTYGYLTKVMYWDRYRTLTPTLGAAILGVKGRPSLRYLVDPTGTRRRLRALAAIGWTFQLIADELGVQNTGPQKWCTSPHVARYTADRVADLYKRWSDTPGPSTSARLRAAAKGWVPPIAWDDDTIDDPAAVPALDADPDPSYVDEEKVYRAIHGFRVPRLTDAEVAAAVRRLMRTGVNFTRACDRLSVNRDRAKRLLGQAAEQQNSGDQQEAA